MTSGLTWKAALDSLKSQKQEADQGEVYKNTVEIGVDTKGLPYFMVMPLSDLHVGAQGTNYESLEKHLNALKDHNIYTILTGDIADWFSPAILASAMSEDIIGPNDQAIFMRRFFKEFADNILAVTTGNHDDWVKRTSGVDIYSYLVDELKIPMIKNQGIITLNINDQVYRILASHKLRYNSTFNYTHAGKQTLRMGPDNIDLVLSGDRHLGAIEHTTFKDRVATVLQTGTFKEDDGFGRAIGAPQRPKAFFPVLAFDGRRHNLEAFQDLDAAVEFTDLMADYVKKNAQATLGLANYEFPRTNEWTLDW